MYHHEGLAIDDRRLNLISKLRGGMAVPDYQGEVSATSPCSASIQLGRNMVGCKETVVDSCPTLILAIAYEAAVVVAFISLETAVELAVSYSYSGIIAQTRNETSIGET